MDAQPGRCLAHAVAAIVGLGLVAFASAATLAAPDSTENATSNSSSDAPSDGAHSDGAYEPAQSDTANETEETDGNDEPSPFLDDLWTRKNLTGDWYGARSGVYEETGLKFSLTYQSQFLINTLGGKDTENGHDFAGSADYSILLDLDKAFGLKGGEIFFRAVSAYGDNDFDKEYVGGLAKTNGDGRTNISIFVDKYWWRQRLLDDRIEFRVGRLSAKDLFDKGKYNTSEDTQFLNKALSGVFNLPLDTGLGVFVKAWPTDWFYVSSMIIDAESQPRRVSFTSAFTDDAVYTTYTELGFLPNFAFDDVLPGEYRVGFVYLPGEFEIFMDTLGGRLVQDTRNSNAIVYFSMDQKVWQEPQDKKQGLGVFATYGYGPGEVTFAENTWSVGASYTGLIPSRDKDVTGFGVAQTIISDDARALDRSLDRETVYEFYYAIEVTPWLAITPDIQWINQPSGDQDRDDSLVAALRVRMKF